MMMMKVDDLRAGWEQEKAATQAASEKKGKKNKIAPDAEDDELFPEDDADQEAAPSTANLFEDSDSDDSDNDGGGAAGEHTPADAADKPSDGDALPVDDPATAATTQEDLFGDSSDEESDEELRPSSSKRNNEDSKEEQPTKKMKVFEEEEKE